MTSVEQIGEHSRDQHRRYYTLFGPDPANGDGFTQLHTSIREIGQHAADIQAWLNSSGFTSAADAGIAAAARDDQHTLHHAAAIAAAAAAITDSSAHLNQRGAAAIAASMQGEASRLSVIPDKISPDAMMQALATIDTHQSQSLSTVEQFASTAQDLGQLAHMAGTHPTAIPAQLAQMDAGAHLPDIAQPAPPTGLEQLSQPLTPQAPEPPAPPPSPDDIDRENRGAPEQHHPSVTVADVAPATDPSLPEPDEIDTLRPNPGVRETPPESRPSLGADRTGKPR